MTHILITGLSGTGKSTILNLLHQRGHRVVETDDPGWCIPENGDWTSPDNEWIWDETRLRQLLNATSEHLFVAGCRQNQDRLYRFFSHVVLLTAPLEIMLDRVDRRKSNPFGKIAPQRATIEASKQLIEPLLIRGASLTIDTSVTTPAEIAERMEALLGHQA